MGRASFRAANALRAFLEAHAGASVEEQIEHLYQNGHSKGECRAALYFVSNLELDRAEQLVHESAAFVYRRDSDAAVREIREEGNALQKWVIEPPDFDEVLSQWRWELIPNCPGRYILKEESSLSPSNIIGGKYMERAYTTAKAHDPVHVVALSNGGLISYRKDDGRYVHTLGDYAGFTRKVKQLELPYREINALRNIAWFLANPEADAVEKYEEIGTDLPQKAVAALEKECDL